jgi:hypothetical protein
MITQKQAYEILFNSTPIEEIDRAYETPDYYEFVGSCGGDVMRYRVYKKDGSVYEK